MTAFATSFLLLLAVVSVLFAKRRFRVLLHFGLGACALGLLAIYWPVLLPDVFPHESVADGFVRQLSHQSSVFDSFLLPGITALFGAMILVFGAGTLCGLLAVAVFYPTSRHLTTRSSEQAGR